MWEPWAAVLAALTLAFGLAKHNPARFDPFAAGILFVAWPLIGAMIGWDVALVAAVLSIKAALKPDVVAAVLPAIKSIELPGMVTPAAVAGAFGLSAIRGFVSKD